MKDIVEFWNSFFPKEAMDLEKESYPFDELIDIKKLLLAKDRVLDFGCGSGWFSFLLGMERRNQIVAVDPAPNACEAINKTISKYNLENNMICVNEDEAYFSSVPDAYFDGIFICNVLDVLPFEKASYILKQLPRILKNDGQVVILLNPFLSEEMAAKVNLKEIKPHYFVKDDVLRCFNLSNEEWIEQFSMFFDVEKSENIHLEVEPSWYNRRCFILKKKI